MTRRYVTFWCLQQSFLLTVLALKHMFARKMGA
jgi:hypothetical protein